MTVYQQCEYPWDPQVWDGCQPGSTVVEGHGDRGPRTAWTVVSRATRWVGDAATICVDLERL